MYLHLIRRKPKGEALQGKLLIDGTFFCHTLERQSVAIPELIYAVEVTRSPRFQRLLPILQTVPSRTGIRIHQGTQPQHSQGCILVPPDKEKTLTEILLQAQRNHEDIRLEISPHLPAYTDSPCPVHLQAHNQNL